MTTAATVLLASETNGIAASFIDDSITIRDVATPANDFAGSPFPKLTFTRASIARYWNSSGLNVQAAINESRIDYDPVTLAAKGLLIEGTRTNVCIQNRDLTNAAWVKVTMSAVKTATGIDGVANSASTITASGALATIKQTIVLASSLIVGSFYLKRRTGTGAIAITQDGATFTTVVLTSVWQRFQITYATITNPVIGIRITTSGDEIDVDFGQVETVQAAEGSASSPIATTTIAVARSADNLSISGTLFPLSQTAGTLYAKISFMSVYSDARSQWVLTLSDTTINEYIAIRKGNLARGAELAVNDGGVSQAVVPIADTIPNLVYKLAGVYALSDFHFARNSILAEAPDIGGTLPTTTRMNIGQQYDQGSRLDGWIQEFLYVPRRMTNTEIQDLTPVLITDELDDYSLGFSDDFDTLSLRTGGPTKAGYNAGYGIWTPRHPWSEVAKGPTGTNNEYQFYPDPAYAWGDGYSSTGQLSVANSILTIRAESTPAALLGKVPNRTAGVPFPWVSGILSSRSSLYFKAPVFVEVKAKIPSGNACWPAIWMYNQPLTGNTEIDIMEALNTNTDEYTSAIHYSSGPALSAGSYQLINSVDLSLDYHDYGVLWADNRFLFCVDRKIVWAIAQPALFEDVNMFIYLNLAMGGDFPGTIPDGTTPDPSLFLIDWVKIYKKDETPFVYAPGSDPSKSFFQRKRDGKPAVRFKGRSDL